MKKLLLTLFLMMFTTTAGAVISPDNYYVSSDVTLHKLSLNQSKIVNEINSLPGGNIQNTSITHGKLDANSDPVNRWDEAFNNFIYTGILPGTGTRAAAVITAGTAYIQGMRVIKAETTPGSTNYEASKDIYVDLDKNGVFHYTAVANGAGEPVVYDSDSMRIAKVVTNATDVTSVVDKRVLGISLSVEDFYIKGMELISVTPDTSLVSVDTGVCYVGDTRIAKTTRTTCKFTDASNWWDGAVDTYAHPGINYIGVKNDGSIKFIGENAPDYADTDGTTTGTLRYWKDTSSNYWRVIGGVPVITGDTLATPFYQEGDWIWFDEVHMEEPLRVVASDSDANTAFKSADCGWIIPSFSNYAMIEASDPAAGCYLLVRRDAARTSNGRQNHIPATGRGEVFVTMTDQVFEYKLNSDQTLTLYVSGYYIGGIR